MTEEVDIRVRVDEIATVEYDEDEVIEIHRARESLEEHAIQRVRDRLLAMLAANFDEKVELEVI